MSMIKKGKVLIYCIGLLSVTALPVHANSLFNASASGSAGPIFMSGGISGGGSSFSGGSSATISAGPVSIVGGVAPFNLGVPSVGLQVTPMSFGTNMAQGRAQEIQIFAGQSIGRLQDAANTIGGLQEFAASIQNPFDVGLGGSMGIGIGLPNPMDLLGGLNIGANFDLGGLGNIGVGLGAGGLNIGGGLDVGGLTGGIVSGGLGFGTNGLSLGGGVNVGGLTGSIGSGGMNVGLGGMNLNSTSLGNFGSSVSSGMSSGSFSGGFSGGMNAASSLMGGGGSSVNSLTRGSDGSLVTTGSYSELAASGGGIDPARAMQNNSNIIGVHQAR